jgi:hypothetical protein
MPAPSLVLYNMPTDTTAQEVMHALHPTPRFKVADVVISRGGFTTCAYVKFHTIMEAEETMRDYPAILLREDIKTMEWPTWPARSFGTDLIVHDCASAVDELVAFIESVAPVKELARGTPRLGFVIVHFHTDADAEEVQRKLHGVLFRGVPLFLGCELPGFRGAGVRT